MKVYSLLILNKAGGLIYQNDTNPELNRLGAIDYLVLSGKLHGAHAIASNLSQLMNIKNSQQTGRLELNAALISLGRSQNLNTNRTGLQSLETDFFNLYVFQSLTGIKFIIVTSPNNVVHAVQGGRDIEELLKTHNKGELEKQFDQASELYKKIYMAYSDYVMKNPFYSLDMPIKNELFDQSVVEILG